MDKATRIICKLDPDCHYCAYHNKYFYSNVKTVWETPLCLRPLYTKTWKLECGEICQVDLLRWVE